MICAKLRGGKRNGPVAGVKAWGRVQQTLERESKRKTPKQE